jgi:hypothetical protein
VSNLFGSNMMFEEPKAAEIESFDVEKPEWLVLIEDGELTVINNGSDCIEIMTINPDGSFSSYFTHHGN